LEPGPWSVARGERLSLLLRCDVEEGEAFLLDIDAKR